MAPKTPREGRSLSLPNPLRLSSVPLIGSLAFRKRPSPAPPEEPHSVSYSAADVQIPGDLTTPSVSAIPPGDTAPSSNVADDTSTQPEATNSTQPPSEVNPPKILSHLVKPDDDKASRDAAILLQRRARFNLKFRAKQVGGGIINVGKAGLSGAISGASTGIMMAGEFASLPVHAAGATKRGMVGMTHSMVARKLERFYDRTLKPAITEPQDYPWWVRQFIHDFADHLWRNLSVELLTIFETKEEDEGTDEVSIQTDRKSSHKSSSSRSAAAPSSAASLSSRRVETLYPLVRKTDECQSSTANDSVCQSGSFASDSAPSPPASPPEVSKTTPVNAAANKIASSFRLHKSRRLQKSLTGSTTLEEPAADYWIDANGGVDTDGFAASFMARSWRRFTRWLQLDMTRVLIKVELRTVKGLFRSQESDDALRESLLCGTASARVQVGPHLDRSRRVKLEPGVEPVWNQCFPEPHARRPISMDELCAHPLCVEIFHDDYSLGKATVPAAQLRSLCIGDWPGNAGKASKLLGLGEEMAQFADGPGRSDVREFEEPLSTWGTAVLHVHMRRRERPNWLHWMRLICDNWPLSMLIEAYHDAITVLPRMWQFLRAFNLMALADRVRDEQTLVTLQVTILRAQNLLNTDISSILGMHVAGASDPYCIVHCGGQQEKTETIQDNLNPIWDETFEFTMSEFELINEGLSFEMFDEDSFTVDDPLGIAFIDKQTLQRLIHEGPREDGLVEEFGPLSLQLEERPVQGAVWVRVGVVSLDRPPTMLSRRLWEAMVKPLLMKVRAFILYYRVPYDMSVFDKYRSYKAVTLTLIASSTNILLRGLFFTAYLLAISRELDEYQLIYFIMVLKGSQFISGLFSLIIMCIEFWQCTAGSNEWEGATIGLPSACELNGPGVSSPDAHRGLMPSVIGKVLLLLWLQALLFLAFLLLPYAGKYNPKSGKISYERSRRLWKQSEENVKREASMRARWREARQKKQSLAEESKVLRRAQKRAQSTPGVPEGDIDLEAGLPVQEMADALSMTPQGFSASPHGRATEQRESTSRPPTSMSEESASPPPMFEHSSSLSGYTFGSMLHSGTYRYDRLIDEEDIDQLIRNGKIGLPPPELLGDDKFSLERAQHEMQNAKRRELAERERKLRKIPLSRTIERTKGFFKSVGRATAHSVTFGKHRSGRGTDKLRFNVTPVEGLMLAIRARGPKADTPRVAGSTPWPFELRGPDEAVKLLSSYVLPRPTSAFTFSSSGSTSTTATKVSGGQITPPHGITIDSAETREAAGIPLEATHFAFAFPLPLAAEALNLAAEMEAEGRPVPAWLNFCLIGGFVYLRMDNDGHCSFLSANALSSANEKEFADGEGMTFVGPLPVSQVSGEALKMSHRMKPLTLNLNGMHMTSFGWVNPGEAPGGIPLDKGPALAFGAFVYATSNGRYCKHARSRARLCARIRARFAAPEHGSLEGVHSSAKHAAAPHMRFLGLPCAQTTTVLNKVVMTMKSQRVAGKRFWLTGRASSDGLCRRSTTTMRSNGSTTGCSPIHSAPLLQEKASRLA